jgi:hypothetical protein
MSAQQQPTHQPAQLLHPGVHRGFEGLVITHVDFGREDAAVMAFDQIRGLGQVLRCGGWEQESFDRLADVDGNDVRTLLRQSHRMRAALTARRPGDERDLAFDSPSHNYLNSLFLQPGS